LRLAGSVANAAAGVVIELEGADSIISDFERRLPAEAPAASCIINVARIALSVQGARQFAIAPSAAEAPCTALLPPDQATCRDCIAELFDPGARHFRYPFIACAACGPRFSVIAALPYDRERTAMLDFPLCPACRREYGDAADRRYHAETNSCAACGPRLRLLATDGAEICVGDDAVHRVADLLRAGKIVAVKGIGGYHLMVRADDAAAVRRLRERKRRPTKPFAVMFLDVAAVTAVCEVNAVERDALGSAAAPIVLLRRRDAASIADAVAPGNPRLGVILPYAPLHHLLLSELALPVVATSFNRSGDQLVFDDDAALACARDLADAVLTHDRVILRPVEDTVLHVVAGAPMVLRLGRGFAPLSVPLRGKVPPLLALGGHLKNAPAVTVAAQAVLAPQLGDLDDPATLQAHRTMVQD
jgi:hydrogenase maturation protein HypF